MELAPSVRLEDVVKRFGDFTAVRNLALDIERGEFFTMLGPSGCGKTTTLRMIAGFEEPSEGRILLEGVDVAGLPAFKRPTNTVFQSYALFPHLSVEKNVAFGLERRGVSKADVRRRVGDELERVGLRAEARRKPRQLSGGQQQRVALARALVNRPAVLLLDEPLGALDLKLRKGLQLQLKQIQRDVGITFVYVTHDQEEALTMSDRIAVMNEGIVEQLEAPEDVYERPRTTFVAGFIGVSNLMPGEVVSGGASARVLLDSGLEVAGVDARGLEKGRRCHVVVRPEKLELHPVDAATDGRPSLEGTIESSLYLGTATQVVVRLPGDVSMTVLVPNADDAARRRLPTAGDPVRLSWAQQHMHVVRGPEAQATPQAPPPEPETTTPPGAIPMAHHPGGT
jgi:spermidine/putrescine transport system ATP-binding protein